MIGSGTEIINFIKTNGTNQNYEIRIKKLKRSKNANAYMWELLQKLAEVYSTSKIDLYKKYVKEYGIFRTITLNPEAVKTFEKIWGEKGIGWFTEILDMRKNEIEVIAYYGTSSYNTKQFYNIVQHIVDDCKEEGIETLTPKEIMEMGL